MRKEIKDRIVYEFPCPHHAAQNCVCSKKFDRLTDQICSLIAERLEKVCCCIDELLHEHPETAELEDWQHPELQHLQ